MSHIRHGLLCWGRTNKRKINEINVLLNKALRCIHYKKYNECKKFESDKKNIKLRKFI